MPIIGIVITLAVIGLIMWLIDQIPMDGTNRVGPLGGTR